MTTRIFPTHRGSYFRPFCADTYRHAAAMRTLEDDSPDPYQPAIDALYAAQRAHGMTPAQLRGDR